MKDIDWKSLENHFLLNPRLPENEATSLVEMTDVLSKRYGSPFRAHVFLLTSGTTGQYKWVALSKEALLTSAEAVNRHLQATQNDTWIHPLPDFHVGGLGIWARAYLSQSNVVVVKSWSADQFYKTISENSGTLASLVPTQLYDLVSSGMTCPPSMRAIVIGGGALSPELYTGARKLGWPVLPSYGMTEASSQIATADLESLNRLETPSLHLLSHFEAKACENGQMSFRGLSLLSAYVLRENSQVVIRDPKEDGWFLSQDCGKIESHCLQVQGRLTEFVKIGGESVELSRLRRILEKAKFELGIAQTDVEIIPYPDQRLGHVIHLVTEKVGNEIQNLVDRFNNEVLAFEKIRKWHHLDSIPRTELGKLLVNQCVDKTIAIS